MHPPKNTLSRLPISIHQKISTLRHPVLALPQKVPHYSNNFFIFLMILPRQTPKSPISSSLTRTPAKQLTSSSPTNSSRPNPHHWYHLTPKQTHNQNIIPQSLFTPPSYFFSSDQRKQTITITSAIGYCNNMCNFPPLSLFTLSYTKSTRLTNGQELCRRHSAVRTQRTHHRLQKW